MQYMYTYSIVFHLISSFDLVLFRHFKSSIDRWMNVQEQQEKN